MSVLNLKGGPDKFYNIIDDDIVHSAANTTMLVWNFYFIETKKKISTVHKYVFQ